MARLSGLPSEHHPQGPGDSTRRRKRKQAPADSSKTTKRAASPTPAVPQVKRKRLDVDAHDEDDEDQLARELQEAVSRSQSRDGESIVVATEDLPTRRHNRRHSEPVVAGQDGENDSQMTPPPSTAPLVPNVQRRVSGVRRARMSMPAQLYHADEELENSDRQQYQFAPLKAVIGSRARRRLRRSHLSQEVNTIEQHDKEDRKLRKQFAELRAKLQEKDDTIKDLEFQLEARRMGDIDMTEDRAQELEQQLSQAKDEIDQLRRSSLYTGDSREPSAFSGFTNDMEEFDEGDDDLLLIDPNDIDGPTEVDTTPLANGIYAQRALELSTQVTVKSLETLPQTQYDSLADPSEIGSSSVADKISDQAVSRYANEIERLVQQLAESQGALRVLAIELQNLNVVAPGASSNTIISSLRNSFEVLREGLENLIPKSTLGLTNSELLRKIPDLFEDVLSELREKVISSETHHQNEQLLRSQFIHVIDLLARSDNRIEKLENHVSELKEDVELKQAKIERADELAATQVGEIQDLAAAVDERDVEIDGLKKEVEDKDTSLDRLRDSLENYRTELNQMTATITQLEEDHREAIATLEDDHADVVNDLETRLASEIEGRDIAENDAMAKKEYIEDLEQSVERMEEEFEVIKEELDRLRQRLAEETELLQTTEEERDVQTNLAYDHANKIENLEETLEDVQNQLAEAKEQLANERTLRAETEAHLQTAEDEIAQLEDQLHNAGVQANELRSKLFQVQQDKEQAVADLEEAAEEQAALSQEALDDETEKREAAEAEVVSLGATIDQLQSEIAGLDRTVDNLRRELADTEKNRDDHVASLEAQLAEVKNKYAALENNTNSTITTLQANITDLTNEVNAQAAELERERAEAAENDRVLRETVAEKTETIVQLESDLAKEQSKNADLERENKSLSERVEEEASEMLRISDAHHDESTALRSTIATHESTIANLQSAAAAREAAHASLLAEKESEIQDLRVLGDARATHIVDLESQIDELKEAFRLAEEDTRLTIDALTETQQQLQLKNQNLAHLLKQRNAAALKAVQELKVKGVQVRTNGANGDLHRVAGGKVTKVNERVKIGKGGRKKEKVAKRQWDSGFHEAAADDEDVDGENLMDGSTQEDEALYA
ncbi:hypothetical protein DM02DRAFT_614117 [Periconia macrospinosa]|uniref:Uncharacterized protein n=1 Tax=Periconia macrospinosa TaxID=97972 RepID=A0A2V1DR78_9PLEO|nr:hypothetical protein DM02DRAFT_614117 [Periconia macrospinosa]